MMKDNFCISFLFVAEIFDRNKLTEFAACEP
jgi:hypothetical protein